MRGGLALALLCSCAARGAAVEQTAPAAPLPTPAADPAGGPVFRVTEWDDDGGKHRLPITGGMVDVNSTLVVEIAHDRLRGRLLESFGGPEIEPDVALSLRQSLDKLQLALPRMEAAFQGWSAGARAAQDVDALSTAMQAAGGATADLFAGFPPAFTQLVRPRFNQRMQARMMMAQQGGAAPFRFVESFQVFYEVVAEALDETREKEIRKLQQAGVVVRFGAWSTARDRLTPLHLEGFDRLPTGEFVEIERVVVSLSPEQRDEWEGIVTRARELRESGVVVDFRSLAGKVLEHVDALLGGPVKELEGTVEETSSALAGLPADAQERLRGSVQRIRDEVAAASLQLRTLRDKYRLLALGADLESLAALGEISSDLTALRSSFDRLMSAVSAEAEQIRAVLAQAGLRIGEQVARIRSTLDALAVAIPILAAGSQVDVAVLEFAEEVLALDVANVPRSTALDLRYTGRREPGDRVVFLMKGGPESQADRHELLDTQQFTLFRLLPHVTTAVSLNFANASGPAGIQNEFQAAPTYNLLYKWGRRDSAFWNRFLTPGVGLALSALDLDGNDDLEPGIGATVSLFRDWIQLGYGYDLGTDDGYWFFGLSLPLTNVALSAGRP